MVADMLGQKLELPDEVLSPATKKMAAKLWARVRRACLKWARRKKPQQQLVELIQTSARVVHHVPADAVLLMQTSAASSRTVAWPPAGPANTENEQFFYAQFQNALEMVKNKHKVRDHVSQLLYFVKKLKLEGVASLDRLNTFRPSWWPMRRKTLMRECSLNPKP